MKNTTKAVRRRLDLDDLITFHGFFTNCPHVMGPDTLLIDTHDRLYLADLEHQWDGDQKVNWVLKGGKRWKRLEHVVQGELLPTTLATALRWFHEHEEAYDGWSGWSGRLCGLAADAMAKWPIAV